VLLLLLMMMMMMMMMIMLSMVSVPYSSNDHSRVLYAGEETLVFLSGHSTLSDLFPNV